MYGMHCSRSTVYAEGSEKHYHRVWQKFKHSTCCPCGVRLCSKALEGLQTGNSVLVKAHLTHANSISDEGKTAFDYLMDCPETERYSTIYAILIAKGFNPLIKHGTKRAALYDIIDMQNLELLTTSISSPVDSQEKYEQFIRYLYRQIDGNPLERNIFQYQALFLLAEKNPSAAQKVTSERRADRMRRTTVSATNLSAPTRREDLARHHSETAMPHLAWQQ